MALVGMIIVLGLGGWIGLQYELSPISRSDHSSVRIKIDHGSSTLTIGEQLSSARLVRNKYLFLAALEMTGKGTVLQAGTYSLSRSMSVRQMINKIVRGETDSVVVSFPEGFTASQIADRLESKHLCNKIDFLKVVATQGDQFSFDDGFNPPRDLEGYLYPLTYTILRTSTPVDIVKQMLTAFDTNVVQQHQTVHDWRTIVIVASLIEREALLDSDRPIIASVYYNRLRIGMPLQCDATVQYALPEHKTRLLFSDLRVNSPYNTYLHHGLPPGPICSPGEKSIDAAISPAKTDYLFYVAGPGGAHIFSRTLAEQDRQIASLRGRS